MNDPKLPFFNPYDQSEANIRKAVGQLLMVGFPGATDAPPESIREALAEDIGGVILFRRNVESVDQVATLNEAIHEAAKDAVATPFVAVDQEGGRVVRVREPLTKIPPMRALGDANNPELTAQVSEVIATEIGALGFNVNFAPVIDVDTNPDNPVIGDRAFSRDPGVVSGMGGAFLVGHIESGVVPCGKHFPGHGDTDTDSHLTLPVLDHDPERLESVELVPFERLIGVDIPMLMTAHIMVPRLDTVHPATLSHAIMTRLLREELGYDGVVVTDDLEMKAVAENYQIEEMIDLGLRAGIDLFLICHTEDKWRRAHARLLELALENDFDRARVFESANRVVKLKQEMLGSWKRPWTRLADWHDVLGCEKHQRVLAMVEDMETGADPTEKLH